MQTYNFHYSSIKQASIAIFFFNAWRSKAYRTLQTLFHYTYWAGKISHPNHPWPHVMSKGDRSCSPPTFWRGAEVPVKQRDEHPASCIPVPALLLIRHPQATRLPSWLSFRTPTDFTDSPHGLKLYPVFFFSSGKGNLSFFSNESFELH